ncbi:DUF6230 family protein [Actinokineospora soli]|uniref:DUF6230 family protein n=1 Tax=Actinokineospora soli TaxID=1048753 RepID=A0ABW2TLN4_9PSEU
MEKSKEQRGRTRWGRAAVVAVPALGAIGAMTAAMAQGLLAATFAVSGVPMTVKSGQMQGTGFAGTVYEAAGQGVTYVGLTQANLDGLCAAVSPTVPIVGVVTLKITAGDADPATTELSAGNLLLDAKNLTGNGEFTGLKLGISSAAMDVGPTEVRKGAGDFGLQAGTAKVTGLNASALSAQVAGTFKLDNLSLGVTAGQSSC